MEQHGTKLNSFVKFQRGSQN